jgi:hypothetical protein
MTDSFIANHGLGVIGAVGSRFFEIGFTHILPNGLDHILFLLGLFFLSRSVWILLVQMTLFTLAHSLTLGLGLYGIVSNPISAVELAIALSIVFVAVENLFHEHLSKWRPWMVFGCGLVHGLGFAHSFQTRWPAREDFLVALFSYNLGIEMGQLVIVGVAYALFGGCWKREWYRGTIAMPASALIALSGLGWALL